MINRNNLVKTLMIVDDIITKEKIKVIRYTVTEKHVKVYIANNKYRLYKLED